MAESQTNGDAAGDGLDGERGAQAKRKRGRKGGNGSSGAEGELVEGEPPHGSGEGESRSQKERGVKFNATGRAAICWLTITNAWRPSNDVMMYRMFHYKIG